MKNIQQIETKREAVLEEMRAIRSLRRGTVNEQYLRVYHKGKKQPVLRGPYCVVSRKEENKTVSERLTDAAEVERTKRDVETYKRFMALCKEFAALTERLGALESAADGPGVEKKRHRSPSRKNGKSRISLK